MVCRRLWTYKYDTSETGFGDFDLIKSPTAFQLLYTIPNCPKGCDMSGPLIKCFGIHAAFLEVTRGSVLLGGWRWADGGDGGISFPITSSLLSPKSHRYRHTYETWMAVGNWNPLVLAVIKRQKQLGWQLLKTSCPYSWILLKTQWSEGEKLLQGTLLDSTVWPWEQVPVMPLEHAETVSALPLYYYYRSLLYIAILRSRADSPRSHVILHEWTAFYSAFVWISTEVVYLQRWPGWCHVKLLPCRRVLCTPYNHAPCHFMQSHIRKVYACLAVTCHLRFWQNDRGLLRATAVTVYSLTILSECL